VSAPKPASSPRLPSSSEPPPELVVPVPVETPPEEPPLVPPPLLPFDGDPVMGEPSLCKPWLPQATTPRIATNAGIDLVRIVFMPPVDGVLISPLNFRDSASPNEA